MVAHLYVARWQDVGDVEGSAKLEHRQVSDDSTDDDTVATTSDVLPLETTAATTASAIPVDTTVGSDSSSSEETAAPQSTATSETAAPATSTGGTTLKTSRKNSSTTRGLITSFPSATATAPLASTMDSNDCPAGYQWWHCADHNVPFLFDGCCVWDPCKHNGYCPRSMFAIAAGQPNTYKLTVNKAFAHFSSQVVVTDSHSDSHEVDFITVTGPYATTVYPPGTSTPAAANVNSSGISGGAAAGIAVGVVAGAFIIFGGLLFWWWRRRQAKAEAAPTPGVAGVPGVGMPVMSPAGYVGYDTMYGDSAPPYLPYYDEASKAAAGLGGEQLADDHTQHEPAELPDTSAMTASELPGTPVNSHGHESK